MSNRYCSMPTLARQNTNAVCSSQMCSLLISCQPLALSLSSLEKELSATSAIRLERFSDRNPFARSVMKSSPSKYFERERARARPLARCQTTCSPNVRIRQHTTRRVFCSAELLIEGYVLELGIRILFRPATDKEQLAHQGMIMFMRVYLCVCCVHSPMDCCVFCPYVSTRLFTLCATIG